MPQSFTALPDGRVQIAWLEGPIDLKTAAKYAGWLQEGARDATVPKIRMGLARSATEMRGVIAEATASAGLKRQALA